MVHAQIAVDRGSHRGRRTTHRTTVTAFTPPRLNRWTIGTPPPKEVTIVHSFYRRTSSISREQDWSFELEGTQGAVSWNFERMNELNIFRPDGDAAHDGYTRIVSGPGHPFHSQFNPATGTGLGYDDLKTVEAYQFLKSIAEKRQGEPGFAEALRVAKVLDAIERSCEAESWQNIEGDRSS